MGKQWEKQMNGKKTMGKQRKQKQFKAISTIMENKGSQGKTKETKKKETNENKDKANWIKEKARKTQGKTKGKPKGNQSLNFFPLFSLSFFVFVCLFFSFPVDLLT